MNYLNSPASFSSLNPHLALAKLRGFFFGKTCKQKSSDKSPICQGHSNSESPTWSPRVQRGPKRSSRTVASTKQNKMRNSGFKEQSLLVRSWAGTQIQQTNQRASAALAAERGGPSLCPPPPDSVHLPCIHLKEAVMWSSFLRQESP